MKSPSNKIAIQTVLIVATAIGGGSSMCGQEAWDFDLDVVPPSPAPAIEYVPRYVVPPSVSVQTPPRVASPSPAVATPTVPGSQERAVAPAWSIRQNGHKSASRPGSTSATSNVNGRSSVTQIGKLPNSGGARTVAHEEDGGPSKLPGIPIPFVKPHPSDSLISPPSVPTDRTAPPSVLGNHLGLRPGETATERSLRLMSAIGDLERQLEDALQVNASLSHQIQQRDEKLQLAVREIRAARKDVAAAKEEVERLKREIDDLSEKVRSAESDNAAVLQTIAPLLQQLIESDEVGSVPTKPLD